MVKKCAAESQQTKKVSYFSVKEKDRLKWSKALNIDIITDNAQIYDTILKITF